MDAPHFIQVGDLPVFSGAGRGDLLCHCGHVLIKGYLPANFLSIRIKCFGCGEVIETPALPEGEILPRRAVGLEPTQTPALQTSAVPPGAILVCQQEILRRYALTQPREFPNEALHLTRDLVETAAWQYDRLIGGRLAEQLAASPPAMGTDAGDYPFAWSVARLREQVDKPDWSWLYQNDDAIAALHVAAVHHLMQCWGQHPLLPQLAAGLVERGSFLRIMSGFATAKLLHDSGNRVGFSLPSSEVALHFTTPSDEPLSLALLAPDALQWRARERRTPQVLYEAVVDAMAAAKGRVNRARPGMVVLSASIWEPDFDQALVDTIHAAFHSTGRRNRGLAAVAVVMPKVLPAKYPHQLGFGYAFYPIANPHFGGENPIKVGPPLNVIARSQATKQSPAM